MDTFDLKEHLRKLGAGETEPFDCTEGLCKELRTLLGMEQITRAQTTRIGVLILNWPDNTGSYYFPVPHPTLNPSDAFNYTLNLWADDEYGNKRRAMCTWLSEQFKHIKR